MSVLAGVQTAYPHLDVLVVSIQEENTEENFMSAG